MLILNQYILLDPILLFFISGATYTMVKFQNVNAESEQVFTKRWWLWLALNGSMLGKH